MPLLEPMEVQIFTMKGEERTYTISKFPAVAGREIIAKYPLTAIPKVSEYKSNEETMLQLMTYVGVTVNGNFILFVSKQLIENHVPDWETLVKLEIEMMRYNTSFFGKGEISTSLKTILKKVILSISPTLIPLSEQLLALIKPRSAN